MRSVSRITALKWLVLKMADKGHPLGFMSKPEVTLGQV